MSYFRVAPNAPCYDRLIRVTPNTMQSFELALKERSILLILERVLLNVHVTHSYVRMVSGIYRREKSKLSELDASLQH